MSRKSGNFCADSFQLKFYYWSAFPSQYVLSSFYSLLLSLSLSFCHWLFRWLWQRGTQKPYEFLICWHLSVTSFAIRISMLDFSSSIFCNCCRWYCCQILYGSALIFSFRFSILGLLPNNSQGLVISLKCAPFLLSQLNGFILLSFERVAFFLWIKIENAGAQTKSIHFAFCTIKESFRHFFFLFISHTEKFISQHCLTQPTWPAAFSTTATIVLMAFYSHCLLYSTVR